MSRFRAADLRSILELAAPPPVKEASQTMTIMVQSGAAKQPAVVYNTALQMDQSGCPQLWFAFDQGGSPQYVANFTHEGWVADID